MGKGVGKKAVTKPFCIHGRVMYGINIGLCCHKLRGHHKGSSLQLHLSNRVLFTGKLIKGLEPAAGHKSERGLTEIKYTTKQPLLEKKDKKTRS